MGYDSNIKSNKAERRQRSILLLSMAGLALAAFVVVSLLHKGDPLNPTYTNTASVKTISIDTKAEESKPKVLRATTQHNGDAKLEAAAALHVAKLDEEVRALKKTGIIMETDPNALEITAKLQRATRELIKLRYGEITDRNKNFRVRLELEFQNTIPDFEEKGKDGSITIEMAPIELIPCSVSCTAHLGMPSRLDILLAESFFVINILPVLCLWSDSCMRVAVLLGRGFNHTV